MCFASLRTMRLGTAMCWGVRDYAKPGESDLTPNSSHDLYPPFPIHRDKLGTFSGLSLNPSPLGEGERISLLIEKEMDYFI